MVSNSFSKLEDKEQQRIIDCCIEEFAEYGYREASTNRIVKAIGVAKGSLFNYFYSKENLYLYLLYLAAGKLLSNLKEVQGNLSRDICTRFKGVLDATLRFYADHPRLFKLFMSFAEIKDRDLIQKYLALFSEEERRSLFNDIFEDIDTGNFAFSARDTVRLFQLFFNGIKFELYFGEPLPPEDIESHLRKNIDLMLKILQTGIFKRQSGETPAGGKNG